MVQKTGEGGGGRDRWRIIEKPGTDHVTSGPIKGLKKTAPDGAHRQTDRHLYMATV